MYNINKKLISSCLFVVFFSFSYANAEIAKGEAIIMIADKTYTLALKKCYDTATLVKGKEFSAFIISTHTSRVSKVDGPPVFTLLGTQNSAETKASYRLSINGGVRKDGVGYRGKLPFSSFSDNKLVYKGEANSLRKVGKKLIKAVVPIEITVTCL